MTNIIDKKIALRHLTHAAIRMMFREEDPFALHVTVYAADNLVKYLLAYEGVTTSLDPEQYIKTEYLGVYYSKYRELYNYFKHASKDASRVLEISNVCDMNEIFLFLVCCRAMYMQHGLNSKHVEMYMAYFIGLYPSTIKESFVRNAASDFRRDTLVGSNRREMFPIFNHFIRNDEKFIAEYKNDVSLTTAFFNATIT